MFRRDRDRRRSRHPDLSRDGETDPYDALSQARSALELKSDATRKAPGILRGKILVWIVGDPQEPGGPVAVRAESPTRDVAGVAHSTLAQQIQRSARVAKRNPDIRVPVPLLSVKAIIGY